MDKNILRNIHSTAIDYQRIAELYEANREKRLERINLGIKDWFDAPMAGPLGAILDLLQNNINNVVFSEIDNQIKTVLQKNGFLSYFGYLREVDINSTTIQYKKMNPSHGADFRSYVQGQFLNRSELPHMSTGLRKKMAEVMFELFNNATLHSKTTSIYTCGQFFPARKTIEFCIVDVGIGFQRSIFDRFGQQLAAVDAIKWAVQNMSTTKVNVSGGIGLAILKEFIGLNGGEIQIVSNEGFYQYRAGNEFVQKMSASFPGSIVKVGFKTDDTNNYALGHEIDEPNFF